VSATIDMMSSTIAVTGRPGVVAADLLDSIAQHCPTTDNNADFDGRGLLRRLADGGYLDLGLADSAGSYRDQARVLAELASVCMTSAFTAWAHRMTVEYLVVFGGRHLSDLTEQVRSAERPGSTALAGTFRAAAGVADLPVTVVDDRASGVISWASNLYDDAVVVTGIGRADAAHLIAFDRDAPGVEVRAVTGLMALDGTHSGALRLTGMPVESTRVLSAHFDDFITGIRPTFLTMQSAFALGLSSASLDSIPELDGPAAALAPEVADARRDLARLSAEVDRAAAALDHGAIPSVRSALGTRLEASHLATRATQLELAVRGGSGYAASSPTARRVREALFLPVQSPTEVQLQWELRQSA
jgi:alkylation response protein AidB-like acyl-CoA dehydrogenase